MPPTIMIMSHLLFDILIKYLLEMGVKFILPVITIETVYRYVYVVNIFLFFLFYCTAL